MKKQIVKIINTRFYVQDSDRVIECTTSGKLKNKKIEPLVGDYCNVTDNVITDIIDRKNFLTRPSVANIDQALIVTSLKDPLFSTNLLDKLLLVCILNKITPIICITKSDLLTKSEKFKFSKIIKYYKKLGIKVLSNKRTFPIKRIFKNKTTVFTGQSGSGKSTLLNKLDKSLDFKVGDISYALGRGKHTTRYTTLVNLYGGKVLDTPGFSSIDLNSFTKEEIRSSFMEFKKYRCGYKDCMHLLEDDCMVKQAVKDGLILRSRYDNYVKFIEKR